jgi:ubiquinone/menaquinone biosynthesis C-methylase UbiE
MGRWSRPLAKTFVEWLGLEARAHWLDVGCGTGALTEAICELGKPASVVACDPSGPFLEIASSTLPDKRVSFELGTGERLPDREGGFDAVVSGLVLNFLPHVERGLAAMRARLSPRGVVAAYVWDYAGGIQFVHHFWQAAVALDPAAAGLDESQRFSFCNAEGLVAAFRAAGFGKVEVERSGQATRFASFDDYWEPFLGRTGPAPTYVASLDAVQRDRLREALRERLVPDAGGRIELTATAWMVRGLDPSAS